MQSSQANPLLIHSPRLAESVEEALTGLGRRRIVRADQPLRCVSSSHLAGVSACDCTIPANVVMEAWAQELERTGVEEDRFFHFSWRGEVWRSYGLSNGRVRGVYCSIHSAERHERSLKDGSEDALVAEPGRELALAA
jgi:hypothetical protein